MKKAISLLLILCIFILALASCNLLQDKICQHVDADDDSICDNCGKKYDSGTEGEEKEEYTVTVINGLTGELIEEYMVDAGSLVPYQPVSVPQGYEFLGWFTENGNRWDFFNDQVNSDLVITATFAPLMYSVKLTYKVDGKGQTDIMKLAYRSKIEKPTISADDAADILYWVDENGDTWDFATDVVDGNKVITAVYADGPILGVGNTYNDSVKVLSKNWNPHTYQTNKDKYPLNYITSGLYAFFYNDARINVTDMDPFSGYVILPEMAAEMPIDVTEEYKYDARFNIPADATAGYAYRIPLNPNAKWENGVSITADDYLYSTMMLLDPNLDNYLASDFYSSRLNIAGAEKYAKQGQTVKLDNYAHGGIESFEGLSKDADGNYLTEQGLPIYIAIKQPLDCLNGNTLASYVNAYGDAYFGMTYWADLVAAADQDGYVPCNDTTLAWLADVIGTNKNWSEGPEYVICYLIYDKQYEEFDYANVGLFKTGEYEIVLVLDSYLAGYELLSALSENWLVYEPLYEKCIHEENGRIYSTYNTSLDTTMSYGPYKMTDYQSGNYMTFERNENWFGYTDGKHVYEDPKTGMLVAMYETDKIHCTVIPDDATRELMFIEGRLMTYLIPREDAYNYRDSEYCYVSPYETTFFFILNGHLEAIQEREAKETFDQFRYDLETLTVLDFRKAVAVTFDKEALCKAVSPEDTSGYGLFGDAFIYNPETGARYRDTDAAKLALCSFYSVDVSKYSSLDEAVDSITGYDPVKAKELYTSAFHKALELGYITDRNGDGKSDQTIEISYAISAQSKFNDNLIKYLKEIMNEVTSGTPFEGKIEFIKTAPLGNDWSNKIKNGQADTVLAGWQGYVLNPYGTIEVYVDPYYQYDGKWFDSNSVSLTLTVDVAGINATAPEMREVTLTLRQWVSALNGATETDQYGNTYCFGDGIADADTRVAILAALENAILSTYNYIPMLQECTMELVSRQIYYVTDEYNSMMGYGGIGYVRYNYNDAEWDEYVASQGGSLIY